MKETFVVRAPGKLFLLGEYAVLDGGPAVLAAVDREVEVRLRRDSSRHVTRISAPGHCHAFEMAPGRAAPPHLRFAVAALDAAAQRLPGCLESGGFDIEIASALEQGATGGQKLGLGGSAAVSAGVVAAIYAAAGRDIETSRDEIFATAFLAHHQAQAGIGSGADVAASVYGGLLRFERNVGGAGAPPCAAERRAPSMTSRPGARVEGFPLVTRLVPPAGWSLLVAWSGAAAATAPLVQRYLALHQDPIAPRGNGTVEPRPSRREFADASRASVDAFVHSLAAGVVDVAAVNRNGESLEHLARATGLPLLTADLERIVALGRAAGAGAKLSGAGGGDCAIALTGDQATAVRVASAWRAAGIARVDLRLQTGGVSLAKG